MKGNIYPYRGINGNTYYKVKFGKEINKTFSSKIEAERFLTGIRFETDKGTFDPRDYQKQSPLEFEYQARKYLKIKEKKIKGRSFRNIEREVERMILAWGKTSIKALDYPQFEDFLWFIPLRRTLFHVSRKF